MGDQSGQSTEVGLADDGREPFSFERTPPSVLRPLLAGAVVIVVFAAAGLGIWRLIVTSPEYSLGQAREAIEAGRPDDVEKYVDADLVAEDLIDGGVDALSEDLESPVASLALDGAVDLVGSLVVGPVSDMVMDEVMGLDNYNKPPLEALEGECEVERDGDFATAIFTGDDGTVLILDLAYTGEHWRIVGLGNAQAVAETVLPSLRSILEEYAGLI